MFKKVKSLTALSKALGKKDGDAAGAAGGKKMRRQGSGTSDDHDEHMDG